MNPVDSNHWFQALEKLPTFEDIHPSIAASRKASHDRLMTVRSEMPPHKYYQETCTEPYGQTTRDELVDDLNNLIFPNGWKVALDRLLESEIPPYELCGPTYDVSYDQTTMDTLVDDDLDKKRLAASRKERQDKLMTMPSEMPLHKYYQGTMCTEPDDQTMLDILVPCLDYHIFQNRWKEALDRQLESKMPPYELCGQTYNVPFDQTTVDKLVDDLHNNSRVHQPFLSILGIGGVGKTALTSHLHLYFHSETMNIKDTIDFMLGMDKQETILRKKGTDMDILWCIVDALAEECNCDVDPVLTACQLLKSALTRFGGKAAGDLSKTAMKKERHRLRRIRRMGRRVVPRRRSLAQNRKIRGFVSRSDAIAADNSSLTPERTWRVASAAPQHMTGYLHHLVDYTPASGDQVIIETPNMGPMVVHGRGSVNTASMTLGDVLYVPGLDTNLVSTGQLAQLGYTITIGPYGCRVYKDGGGMNLVGKAHYIDGYLLELDFLRVRASTS